MTSHSYLRVHFQNIFCRKIKRLDLWVADLNSTLGKEK